MPYAVIKTGAPSEYAEIGNQFQRIEMLRAEQEARRAENRNRMWQQAISGGISSLTDAAKEGLTIQHNERVALEREGRQNQEYRSRARDMLAIESGYDSWDAATQAGGGNPLDAMALRRANAQGKADDIRFERQLQQDSRRFDQDQIQQAANTALSNYLKPIVIPPDLMDVIQKTPELNNRLAIAQNGIVENDAELTSQRPRADFMRLLSIRDKHKREIADIVRVASEHRPTPQQLFDRSLVVNKATGDVYGPKGDYQKVGTAVDTMETMRDQAQRSGNSVLAEQLNTAIRVKNRQDFLNRVQEIDGKKFYKQPDGKLFALDKEDGKSGSSREKDFDNLYMGYVKTGMADALKAKQSKAKPGEPVSLTQYDEDQVRQAAREKAQRDLDVRDGKAQPLKQEVEPPSPNQKYTPAQARQKVEELNTKANVAGGLSASEIAELEKIVRDLNGG